MKVLKEDFWFNNMNQDQFNAYCGYLRDRFHVEIKEQLATILREDLFLANMENIKQEIHYAIPKCKMN